MAKDDELDQMLDRMIKSKTPDQVLGKGGLLKNLTKRLVERMLDGELNYLTQWDSQGSGDGQFNALWGVATDAAGDVYVTDSNNGRIQKFRPAGWDRGITSGGAGRIGHLRLRSTQPHERAGPIGRGPVV